MEWGDLFVQVCATSPTTVAHAQRRLLAGVSDLARPRWVQRGFREPHEASGLPMRNLFGQVDGTVQPDVHGVDAALLWVGDAAPSWLRGGSSRSYGGSRCSSTSGTGPTDSPARTRWVDGWTPGSGDGYASRRPA